jgi:hypothetical protein
MHILKHNTETTTVDYELIADTMIKFMAGVDSNGNKFPRFSPGTELEHCIARPTSGYVIMPAGSNVDDHVAKLDKAVKRRTDQTLRDVMFNYRTASASTYSVVKKKVTNINKLVTVESAKVEKNGQNNALFTWRVLTVDSFDFSISLKNAIEDFTRHVFSILYDADQTFKYNLTRLPHDSFVDTFTWSCFTDHANYKENKYVMLSPVAPHIWLEFQGFPKLYYTIPNHNIPNCRNERKETLCFKQLSSTEIYKTTVTNGQFVTAANIARPAPADLNTCPVCVGPLYGQFYLRVDKDIPVGNGASGVSVFCGWCAHYSDAAVDAKRNFEFYVVDHPQTLQQIVEELPQEERRNWSNDIMQHGVYASGKLLVIGSKYIAVNNIQTFLVTGESKKWPGREIRLLPPEVCIADFPTK